MNHVDGNETSWSTLVGIWLNMTSFYFISYVLNGIEVCGASTGVRGRISALILCLFFTLFYLKFFLPVLNFVTGRVFWLGVTFQAKFFFTECIDSPLLFSLSEPSRCGLPLCQSSVLG